ncbi:MAG: hypothetical protein HZA15_11610 [Nitrospirae bacterium]|nr:hypothetical protein [Nitrospirota bacterium]
MRVIYNPIEAFPNDSILRRIDWFGAVSRNTTKESDPDLEVIMSPFIGNPASPAKNKAVATAKQSVFRVGVGCLPLLHIGAIWQGRLPIPLDRYKYTREDFQLNISPEAMTIKRSDFSTKKGPLIPKEYYHLSIETAQAARVLTIEHKGNPYAVIIPAAEIIRFYYALSTKVSKVLFRGDLEGNPDALYIRDKTMLDENDARLIVTAHTGTLFEEIKAMARLAASPDMALFHARGIHTSLMKNSLNVNCSFPEVFPPFQGKTTLTVHGKWIHSMAKWSFLVFWIDYCSFPYPFRKVEPHWYPSNPLIPKEPPEGDQEPPVGDGKRRSAKKRQTRNVNGLIVNYAEPNIHAQRISVVISTDRFLGFKNIEMIMPKSESYSSKHVSPLPGKEPPTELSTGDGTHRNSNTGKFEVMQNPGGDTLAEVPPSPPMFEAIVDALEALKKIDTGKIAYEIVEATEKETDIVHSEIGPITLFPLNQGSESNRWAFIRYRYELRRKALVAKMTYDGKAFYLFESEHRISRSDSGKKKTEHYTTFMIYSGNFSVIQKKTLNDVLLLCTKNEGAWLKEGQHRELEQRKIKHIWKTPEQLAARIYQYMHSAITGRLPEE